MIGLKHSNKAVKTALIMPITKLIEHYFFKILILKLMDVISGFQISGTSDTINIPDGLLGPSH